MSGDVLMGRPLFRVARSPLHSGDFLTGGEIDPTVASGPRCPWLPPLNTLEVSMYPIDKLPVPLRKKRSSNHRRPGPRSSRGHRRQSSR